MKLSFRKVLPLSGQHALRAFRRRRRLFSRREKKRAGRLQIFFKKPVSVAVKQIINQYIVGTVRFHIAP